MSVINKMLRDLDSRQTPALNAAPASGTQPRAMGGVQVVSGAGFGLGRSRVGGWVVATLAAGSAALAGWWLLNQAAWTPRPAESVKVVLATPALPAPPMPLPAMASESDVTTMPAGPVPAATEVPSKVEPSDASPLIQAASGIVPGGARAKPAGLPAPTLTPAPAPVVAVRSQSGAVPAELPPRSVARRAEASAPAIEKAVPVDPLRQSPALEALAHAQRLWSAGSHAVAMDLLQQVLLVTERASLLTTGANSNAELVLLARELARMELAEGRVSEALAMLTRLEPVLSTSAEVWALRGNAAQRLGRHAESVDAYLAALKLRPNEPRWKLGVAVSLAVQGKIAAAAEWAEQARAGGALNAELATYLRQLGVPLREH